MKKLAILAGLMSLALVIGVAGASFHQGKAEARPNHVVAINPDVCASIIGLRGGHTSACYSLQDPANLALIAGDLDGAVDDPATYNDLVNGSAAQLGDDSYAPSTAPGATLVNGQGMWVLSFVTNDDLFVENADEGVWLSSGISFQNACPFDDEDCDQDGTQGDGVVVDFLSSRASSVAAKNTLDTGDAEAVVTQSGVDVTLHYTVVGAPDDLAAMATKTTVQQNVGAACDLSQFASQIEPARRMR